MISVFNATNSDRLVRILWQKPEDTHLRFRR
jgi:hypothetical protein